MFRKSLREWLDESRRPEVHDARFRRQLGEIYSSLSRSAINVDDDCLPVNILVMAGGGLRGYGHLGMGHGFHELSKDGEDFRQYFDLVCGSSVGGVGALAFNRAESSQTATKESLIVMDMARKHVFRRLNWWNLVVNGTKSLKFPSDNLYVFHPPCHSGSLTKSHFKSKLHRRYGETQLYNPSGPKCFAVACYKSEKSNGAGGVEPFLLRTYDGNDVSESPNKENNDHQYNLPGTSDMSLWEAIATTTAAPAFADGIVALVDEEERLLVDGGVIANNPFSLAVIEAARLWPNRPIGIVVSLDLFHSDCERMKDAVDEIKRMNPETMEFFSFLPPYVADHINPWLSSKRDEANQAYVQSREYILSCPEARRAVQLLRTSGVRPDRKIGSLEKNRMAERSYRRGSFSSWTESSSQTANTVSSEAEVSA